MEYVRLCKTVKDHGKLIPVTEDVTKHITDREVDHYKSIYYYNEDHYKKFKEEGSVAGITDVTTPFLVWDFDNKNDVESARLDASDLCARLCKHGVPPDQLRIAFSGNKGFSVEIETDKRFTPEEFRAINYSMAAGLATNDKKIFNANRIFRVPATKHAESHLYKIPLTLEELGNPIDVIQEMAKSLGSISVDKSTLKQISLPPEIYAKRLAKTDETVAAEPLYADPILLDFKFKPKGLPNCKFAVLNGFFEEGARSNVLTSLGSTLKYLGYPKEITYNMLKGAARMQAQRTKSQPFSKKEIWENIIETVFSHNWNGGQYSCKTDPSLRAICESLGVNKCKHDPDSTFIEVVTMENLFHEYATRLDENTVRTGIQMIDDNVQLTIGMPVALLGAPGSGKTSLALDILENTSLEGVESVFFEMDMYGPLVYVKALQRHTGLDMREIQKVFQTDYTKYKNWSAEVNAKYKNVGFSLKVGQTVQEMREAIRDRQDRTGKKVKLVVGDYLECIQGPFSDATANTSKIAGEWKDMCLEEQVCGVLLVQPPKSAGGAGERLVKMQQIKGSSMLEQSFRVIFGIYREGFDPQKPEWDRFLTVSALKNTMGSLFSVDCFWDGVRGKISPIDDDGRTDLEGIRKEKKASKAAEAKEPF